MLAISNANSTIYKVYSDRRFGFFILGIIIFNTLLLTLETVYNYSSKTLLIFSTLDKLCILIYLIEFLIKFHCEKKRYFLSGWNLFDFTILIIALLPFSNYITVLRALRIIRAFRLISMFPAIKRVVNALAISIPGLVSTALLLLLVFLVFGVMAVKLFGQQFPEWFGHLGHSMFSLFQIMTLESWSMGIVRPIMKIYPYAWIFFVPFILISAFILLNFLIGIVVDAIAHLKYHERDQKDDNNYELILERIQNIEKLLLQKKNN